MDFWVKSVKIVSMDQQMLWEIYKKVFWSVFLNVNVFTFGCIYLFSFWINLWGFQFMIWKMVLDLVMMLLLTDVFVYGFHRLMHHRLLYGWSHKMHHELKVPIGLGALYNHWFDYIFATFAPTLLPAIVMSAHPYTVMLWTIITLTNAIIISHGSYAFDERLHFYHHQKFVYNYGIGIFMDKLFKTEYKEN
ncbi:MAG: hypothetical protein Harvfovirus4_45 [Harvfovirus sp.]|uniref:Fatty acid hydroxylase domain-containing protein n=1 Tax=Harvfovirus sp. TaxID=2487768 RepID=A0A3G5A3C0_9VIRU|nr:MAG: hypothetical protein Harvfovirus4_45 [Harvfovirus sp.]